MASDGSLANHQTSEAVDLARRVAEIASEEAFEYWLDVENPDLGRLSGRTHLTEEGERLAVASVIEMALINSSHLVAVMTQRTRESRWVPYEYGRVRDVVQGPDGSLMLYEVSAFGGFKG